ncbi:MAG: transcriptional regulator [Bacteroidota bacterium]|nr:transcriptional regulator [Bacteroidota bacterium]
MANKVIKSEAEYEAALARLEEIMDAEPNTPEGDELELLALLIENYEENNFPLPNPDPIDVIKYYIDQRGLKYKDLVGIIGDKSSVSKVINRERQLNLRMIKSLHEKMHIPYSLLLQE